MLPVKYCTLLTFPPFNQPKTQLFGRFKFSTWISSVPLISKKLLLWLLEAEELEGKAEIEEDKKVESLGLQ